MSISQVIPGKVTIELDGQEWTLSPLKAKHYGEVERQILSERKDPFELIKNHLPAMSEEQAKHVLGLAFDKATSQQRVSGDELFQWMHSFDGTRFMLWLSMRENHPELKYPAVVKMLDGRTVAECEAIKARLDEACGAKQDVEKNS